MSKIFKNEHYQVWRENKCCICGADDTHKLTKHHIVPSCYIAKIKKSIHGVFLYEFDFCCVCEECHQGLNKGYDKLIHDLILEKYGVKLEETSYRKPNSGLPKPSCLIAAKITTTQDYAEFRNFCLLKFREIVKPKFSVYGSRDERLINMTYPINYI
jgi:hypothetical protein